MVTRGKPVPSLEYLAGMFDGEGCLGINRCFQKGPTWSKNQKPHFTARVVVGMIQEEPPSWFHALYGGALSCAPNPKGNFDVWRWQLVGNKQTRKFLVEMIPNLIVKKPQAELLLAFLDSLKAPYSRRLGLSPEDYAERESYWLRIKALNRPAPATTKRDALVTGCDSLNLPETVGGKSEAVSPPAPLA